MLENFCLKHPAQRLLLALGRSFALLSVILDALADPVADRRVVDVHELEADFARVGGFQRGDHVAQFHFVAVAEIGIPCDAVEVGLGEPELFQREAWVALGFFLERIDVCLSVAERAVVVDQRDDLAEKCEVGIARLGGSGWSASLGSAARLRGAEFKAFEKCRPCFTDRFRIFAPLGILSLKQIRILPHRNRRVHWGIGKL